MRIKRFNESISEEELTKINEIGEDMWGIKYPFIGLSKMDIRRISSEAFLPPPGGFNRGIFGTPRSITANNKEVIVLVEFMNLKKSDDRSFRISANKLSEASGKKVDYRSKVLDDKIFVEFKFS